MTASLTPNDIPYAAPTLVDTIEQTHANLRLTPNDDPKLAYQLGIPKTWAYSKTFGPVVEHLMKPQGLGFFAGSTAPGAPVIAVTVTRCPFEIPVDAWVKLTLASEGYEIVAAKYFPGPHGLFFDATAVRMLEDREEVVRTTARVDGSNIFSVNTVCGRKQWDVAKELFWIAHVSFHLVEGTGETRMEPWKAVYGVNPDFQTFHPFSWFGEKVKPAWEGISAVDIRLLNAAQTTVLGYLQVKAQRALPDHPPRDLAALRDDSLAKLKKALGYVPSRPFHPLTLADDPRSEVADGWLGGFAGEAKLGDSNAAVRLGYIRRAELTFSLLALSAPVRDDTLAALRTQRAFEIARDTLQLPG